MENVGYIKVADHQAISSTGISQVDVSKKIYTIYLRQIFETHFIHADPHPGNIFIRPLPTETEREQGLTGIYPGDPVAYQKNRPFQVVFVDFGMVTEVPSRLRSALKEYVIGVATRDAYRIVQSYVQAETLLPGADLKRLEEAHQALLNRFWGANAQQMRNVVFTEGDSLIQEYRDVIYNAPFQFQADMLFSVRAVGILSGIATDLNETFDPWQEIIPFAERLASKELHLNWQEWLKEIATIGQIIYKLPKSVDAVMSQAQRGNLTLKNSFTPESRLLLVRIEKSINTLTWTVASLGLLIAGVYIRENFSGNWLWIVPVALAILLFGWGLWRNRRR
jgi:predicted unusual protein kinase regulating ubiquinone biosynthesis (AarF/ABC1/UbiB family)